MYCQLPNYLKLVLLTADVGALLLPEVVRLDDEGGVDHAGEVVLQHLNTEEKVILKDLVVS